MLHHIPNQKGFHGLFAVLLLAVFGIIGLAGWTIQADNIRPASTTKNNQQSSEYINWGFDGNSWRATDTVPKCEEPLLISPPVDVTRVTSVLYPGQVRGGDFKPHGGLALDGAVNNGAIIYTVRDAFLYLGSRYIEDGELQYMLDFIDPCGVRFRFDHLATLTEEFRKYVEELPGPLLDDSRTHLITSRPFFKVGTAVASEIGHKKNLNVGFDLGVYDLRQRNAASKTLLYKTDSGRINDKEQSFYAVCWFDLLPDRERAIINSLPPRAGQRENTSDYCN